MAAMTCRGTLKRFILILAPFDIYIVQSLPVFGADAGRLLSLGCQESCCNKRPQAISSATSAGQTHWTKWMSLHLRKTRRSKPSSHFGLLMASKDSRIL